MRHLVAIALVFLALESGAIAAKRIAVLSPTGAEPKDAPVRAKIVRALKHNKIQVVTGKRVQKTLQKEGAPSSDADWVNLARKLKVEGFVGSTLSREGKGKQSKRSVEVVIRNGADGSLAGQETFEAKGQPSRLAGFVGASFWKKLGPAVKQTAAPQKDGLVSAGGTSPGSAFASAFPPSETPPKKEEARKEEAKKIEEKKAGETSLASAESTKSTSTPATVSNSSASHPQSTQAKDGEAGGAGGDEAMVRATPEEPSRAGDGLATYEIEADIRTLRRTFDYAPVAAAQHYFLNFNPVAGGRASWYPLRNLGVFAQGEFGAGLETGSYPTGTREILGGAHFRYPFSFGQLGASASYFNHAFLIQDTTTTTDAPRLTLSVPNTVYSGARLAANARFRISDRVHVTLDGAYRLVTNIGNGLGQVKSGQYFPAAGNPTGLDGSAFVGVGVGSLFEIRAGVDYRRYAYGALRGTTLGGLAINASGAVDQYFAISLGVAALLGR